MLLQHHIFHLPPLSLPHPPPPDILNHRLSSLKALNVIKTSSESWLWEITCCIIITGSVFILLPMAPPLLHHFLQHLTVDNRHANITINCNASGKVKVKVKKKCRGDSLHLRLDHHQDGHKFSGYFLILHLQIFNFTPKSSKLWFTFQSAHEYCDWWIKNNAPSPVLLNREFRM